ncbi:hypothetical protein [Candidatus Stoquefichus massiliensis]|uniref:hypothetical protein n=1 Tax=Candidatus Stoquefichus massiliensis TaxID=1470350 RepID=UPI00048501AE|nr:hypothetical protein [Candidatus Stoquefichus massiliensis]
MNKEIKRQLILSVVLLCMLVVTLFFWYDNFIFHTYVNTSDYQYCFMGNNDDLSVNGYEFYKDHDEQSHGGARIVALNDRFFLEGDQVIATFVVKNGKEEMRYVHQLDVKSDNEVLFMNHEKTQEQMSGDEFKETSLEVIVKRDDEKVYEQTLPMNMQQIIAYNGANKNYALQNVYATASWLKTGDFVSTDKQIDKEYPYIIIDYLYLKENGDVDNINDYERFAYVKGKTEDILNGKNKTVAFYDDKGSLLERELRCVVTLTKKDTDTEGYTFMLNLKGAIKAVDSHEK